MSKIRVIIHHGDSIKTLPIVAEINTSISDIKNVILSKLNIPITEQRLSITFVEPNSLEMFKMKEKFLDDNRMTLQDYKIRNETILNLSTIAK